MERISRWPARVALLVSIAAFGATVGAFDAFGGTSPYRPAAIQTSSSPSPSPSESEEECDFAPAPPPICPEPEESESASPSPSPSPTGGEPGSETYRSRVTIDHNSAGFYGDVSSPKGKCERWRRVLVRKIRKGPDLTVGKTNTKKSARWTLASRDTPRGRYYAKVVKRVFTQNETEVTCRGARSDPVRVV